MRRLWASIRRHRDVWVCALLVTVVACVALQRLGLLHPNQQDVLVVDNARTAEVARNLVEGDGYTTNDLPASLVSYYDEQGKLHDEHGIRDVIEKLESSTRAGD